MKVFLVAMAGFAVLASGCASSLKTFGGDGKPSVGIPIGTPVLVKITAETTFKGTANAPENEVAKYCLSEKNEELKFMALGERSYIEFIPAPLGKGEFTIEFNDEGVLKKVTLNSDATAGVDKVNSLLGTVLPYLAAPKPTAAATLEAAGAKVDESAQKMKEKLCLKTETKIISIERAVICDEKTPCK